MHPDPAPGKDVQATDRVLHKLGTVDRNRLPLLQRDQVRERASSRLESIDLLADLTTCLIDQLSQLAVTPPACLLQLLHPQAHRRQRVLDLVRDDPCHLIQLAQAIDADQRAHIVHNRHNAV